MCASVYVSMSFEYLAFIKHRYIAYAGIFTALHRNEWNINQKESKNKTRIVYARRFIYQYEFVFFVLLMLVRFSFWTVSKILWPLKICFVSALVFQTHTFNENDFSTWEKKHTHTKRQHNWKNICRLIRFFYAFSEHLSWHVWKNWFQLIH